MIKTFIATLTFSVLVWDGCDFLIKLWIRYLVHKETSKRTIHPWELKLLMTLRRGPKRIVLHRRIPSGEDYPLSNEEIREILHKMAEKYPLAVIGVDDIYIRKRHLNLSNGVRGSYSPENPFLQGFIFLYTFPNGEDDMYVHEFSGKGDKKASYLLSNYELTRFSAILTFLHELGHHYYYNTTGILRSEKAEEFCDQFASELANEFHCPTMEEEKILIEDFYIQYLEKKTEELKKEKERLENLIIEKEKVNI